MRVSNSLAIVNQKTQMMRNMIPLLKDEESQKAATEDLMHYELVWELKNPFLAEMFIVAFTSYTQLGTVVNARDVFYDAVKTMEELGEYIVQ